MSNTFGCLIYIQYAFLLSDATRRGPMLVPSHTVPKGILSGNIFYAVRGDTGICFLLFLFLLCGKKNEALRETGIT